MGRPIHPGSILAKLIKKYGVTQGLVAKRTMVSRRTINEIVGEKRAITADVAQRLARLFGTTPEYWLDMQMALDLWLARD